MNANSFRTLVLLASLCATLHLQLATSHAQGTAFTYQGRLNDANGPVTGLLDFEFRIFDAAVGGMDLSDPPVVLANLGVTNGLFTVLLNFEGAFTGGERFLEVGVRPGGSAGAYTGLTPRQPVTPTPYALRAGAVEGLRYQAGNQSFGIGPSADAMGVGSFAAGADTIAAGDWSVALGESALAGHNHTFVFSDGSVPGYSTTGPNQFLVNAAGGVGINTNNPGGAALAVNGNQSLFGSLAIANASGFGQLISLPGGQGIGTQNSATYFRSANEFVWFRGGVHSGVFLDPGAGGSQNMRLGSSGSLIIPGTLVQGSDRNVKENFEAVNPREVLEKVAALPVSRWNYKEDQSQQHIGPMAQDFHAAFGVGPDDKSIATVDADGVALAAIQGLNRKLLEGLQRRDVENAALQARLERLEQLLSEVVASRQRPGTPPTVSND